MQGDEMGEGKISHEPADVRDGRQEKERLQEQIAALKARWPRHPVPPALWQELEALEERLQELEQMFSTGEVLPPAERP